MKLSPQGIIDADAVFRYLSDRDLFPKVVGRESKVKTRDEKVWIERAKKEEEA
jgi:hypothetical protein